MRAYGISCGGVTRCNHAAPTVSASRRCLASWGYCNSAEPRRSLVRESAVKPVGKPDALIGHVRFDERGWETGRRSVRQYSRPSSTLQVCQKGRRKPARKLLLALPFDGRGRDGGCPLPPAQTRAGAASAHGSYLGCLASKRTLG